MEIPRSTLTSLPPSLARSRFRNPLRWTLVEKSLCLAAITLAFRLLNLTFLKAVARDRSAQPFADPIGLRGFETLLDGIIVGWCVIVLVGLVLRRAAPHSKIFAHVCVLYFWITDAGMARGMGTLAPAFWVVVLGASVLMLLIFGGRYTYPGIASAASILFVTTYLERIGHLRYAPIFARAPYLPDGQPAAQWFAVMTGTSLAIGVVVVAGAHYLIRRWQEYDAILERLSHTDSLTGLFNRRFFRGRCISELARARRAGTSVGILMVDVDHFKRVNDSLGHQAGDDVLRAVADALAATVRGEDVVARYGGEEFAVLLPETDVEGARRAAERFCQRLAARPIETVAGTVTVTATVGVVATTIADSTTIDELVSVADAALYRGKNAGRNRVECGVYNAKPEAVATSP